MDAAEGAVLLLCAAAVNAQKQVCAAGIPARYGFHVQGVDLMQPHASQACCLERRYQTGGDCMAAATSNMKSVRWCDRLIKPSPEAGLTTSLPREGAPPDAAVGGLSAGASEVGAFLRGDWTSGSSAAAASAISVSTWCSSFSASTSMSAQEAAQRTSQHKQTCQLHPAQIDSGLTPRDKATSCQQHALSTPPCNSTSTQQQTAHR